MRRARERVPLEEYTTPWIGVVGRPMNQDAVRDAGGWIGGVGAAAPE